MNKEIAIIGIAGRFPDAKNLEELCENLKNGKSSTREISSERIKSTTLPSEGQYKTCSYIDGVDLFDYKFFNISLGEAQTMDPHQRLLLEVVQETFDNAAYCADNLEDKNISVFVAAKDLNYYMHAEEDVPTLATGNGAVFMPARIAKHFKLSGNAALIDTSCSSSLVAVHMACSELILEDADMALVNGVNLELFPFKTGAIGKLDLESPDGISRSFAADANGMAYGEAVVSILLKPLDKALADHDNIHAIIKGSAVNNNAEKAAGLTTPDSVVQSAVILKALKKSRLKIEDIDFIEAHGSATQLGDNIEVGGLNLAFHERISSKGQLPISTIKSNIGHSRSASGLVGLVKTVLGLKNNVLFPSIHCDETNPLIDFDKSAVYVNTSLQNGNDHERKYAGVSSIGLSGVNCHVVLEKSGDHLHEGNQKETSEVPQIILVSSKSQEGLKNNLISLKERLLENESLDMNNVSYTLATGRKHFQTKFAAIGYSREAILTQIEEAINKTENSPQRDLKNLVFIASEYASLPDALIAKLTAISSTFSQHYTGMLSKAPEHARDHINIKTLCFHYSYYQLLEKLGVTPNKIVGDGIGKISSSLILGEISIEEGISKTLNYESADNSLLEDKLKAFVASEVSNDKVGFLELGPPSTVTKKLEKLKSGTLDYAIYELSLEDVDQALLGVLKELYLSNYGIKWSNFFEINQLNKIELPPYQFEKLRCWIRETPKDFTSNKNENLQKKEILLSQEGTGLEMEIAELFGEILDENKFDLSSDFFEMGGESVKSTKVIRSINDRYSLDLDFEDIFDYPTIASLAEFVSSQLRTEDSIIRYWTEVLKTDHIESTDNFFQLGGHSLNATQVINRIKKELGVELNFEDFYAYPTVGQMSEYVDKLKSEGQDNGINKIEKVKEQAYYDLSSAQKRLWVTSQFKEGSIAYNLPGAYFFEGEFDQVAFEKTLYELVQRQESLRTTFVQVDGEVKQKIHDVDELNFNLGFIDLVDWNNPEVEVMRLMNESNKSLFDLENGPLITFKIIKIKEKVHVFLLNTHHIISDGWSTTVLLKEISIIYNAYKNNSCHPLKPLDIQYKDHAHWQNASIKEDKYKHKAFWLNYLDGELPRLNIQTDYPRPAYKTWNGDLTKIELDKQFSDEINEFCKEKEVSLFMMLLTSINILMHKYSGQEDLIIGSPISGRNHKELENLIGVFVNNLTFRTTFSKDESFEVLLGRVKENTLGVYKHQDYPFDQLLDDLNLKRDISRFPLFDVGIVLHNITGKETNENNFGGLEGLSAKEFDAGNRVSLLDLRIQFIERNSGIECSFEFNSDLFTKPRVERMILHFKEILEAALKNPKLPIHAINYVSSEEKTKLLEINSSVDENNYPFKPLIKLFEEQLEENPEAIAIVTDEVRLSYKDVDDKVNAFCHLLLSEYNVIRGTKVALMANTSEKAIIAILTIMRCGAVYLPIDPNYPKERKLFILNDAGVSLVVTESEYLFDLEGYKNHLFALDVQLDSIESVDDKFNVEVQPDDLAYIIYTSGSTGTPKGVLIRQDSIAHRIQFCSDYLDVTANDKMIQFASLGFDASLYEIFMTFNKGAGLVIPTLNAKNNIDTMINFLEQKDVSIITLSPAYLKLFQKHDLPSVKKIISTGEAAVVDDTLYYASIKEFYNGYGPTESCIGASFYKVDADKQEYYRKVGGIPIGKPFAGTSIYVLDDQQEQVPVGVPGQIYVGGIGLSSGYLNRPELTTEKFIPNKFDESGSSRLYITGDLGKWNEYGDLEYLGRIDNQVQLSGIRVELDEITSTILKQEGVDQAAVVLKEDEKLVAYVKKVEKIELFPDVNILPFDEGLKHILFAEEKERIEAFKKVFDQKMPGKTALFIGVDEELNLVRAAIEAGAKKIYAIEQNEEIYLKALSKLRELGIENEMALFKMDSNQIPLTEKVDYCFSALPCSIGKSSIQFLEPFKKFVKSEKNIFPKKFDTTLSAISLNENNLDFGLSELSAKYVNNIFDQREDKFDLRFGLQNFDQRSIISSSEVIEQSCCSDSTPETTEVKEVSIKFLKDAIFNGFVISVNVEIDEGINLDSLGDDSYALPIYIPAFDPGIRVRNGDEFIGSVTIEINDSALKPAYLIEGKIIRSDEEDINYRYSSGNFGARLGSHPFYEKLFPNGEPLIKAHVSSAGILERLQGQLPKFMLPHQVKILDNLPLNKNGKIDLNELKNRQDSAEGADSVYIAPRNEFEEALKEIWEKVLAREEIGMQDNFFDLGANSVKAISALTMIDKLYPDVFDITEIFSHPSIEEMAIMYAEKHVEESKQEVLQDLDF